MRRISGFVAVVIASTALAAFAQVKERPIPRIVKKDGRYALFVDDAPYFLLAAQVNNSSGWPAMLPQVWPAMEFLHANTVEIPVYWEQFESRLDMISPDYARDAAGYIKMLEIYGRNDNPLFIPETGGSPRFFFFALGHQAIGFSPFGLDFTRIKEIPDAARPKEELLPPWALTGTKEFVAPFGPIYRMIAPMAREIARLNYEGKLQAVAEEQGKVTQTLSFGAWEATVSYGVWARYGRPAGNPQPKGGALVAQLKDNQFLVAGFYSRVDFRPAAAERHRRFLRVAEGTYENGVFKFRRVLNGDQTDGGLDFSSEPLVLRVSVTTY